MRRSILLVLLAWRLVGAQPFTRGIGVYPGDPAENFAPMMEIDSSAYRNLALHRSAWHSSAYDYNLTAQLVTDGIKDTVPPRWIATTTSTAGLLPRNQRELVLDHNRFSAVDLSGSSAWIQFQFGGGDQPFEIDRVEIYARLSLIATAAAGWMTKVSGSEDGQSWRELGEASGEEGPAAEFQPVVRFAEPAHSRFYRITFDGPGVALWRVGEIAFFDENRRLEVAGPHYFTSAWMPAGIGEEWVYVDLGAPCRFDRVSLFWIRPPAEGALQVSDDAAAWSTIARLAPGKEDIRLRRPVWARYVRVLLERPAHPEGYLLSEIEIYGRDGPVPRLRPAQSGSVNGLKLAGGAWRLRRASLVTESGESLSKAGFRDRDWMPATVPGTVLASFYNAGAVPDPNFGDNQLMVSDSFFCSDFWYRDEFIAPHVDRGQHAWLHFDGINWKAEIFLNGVKIGQIEGGFTRGRFDVTAQLRPGRRNALAVLIEKNANPGSVHEKTFDSPGKNGGALGADNPTFHASVGWDWIPTIRGRNTGIWGDVFLSLTGPVTIENPFVTTDTLSDVTVEATLSNHDATPVTGMLRGRFGDVAFEIPAVVEASRQTTVRRSLHLNHPKLWWPAGYGEPNLYPVELKFETTRHAVSDVAIFQAGVRKFTYSEDGGALRIWINGRRFIPRGGNWGFPESLLRYRAREYDIALRYHREMNFTMIRNWVGQTGDDAFYEACDRYGIVVWQDFWLANPADGPEPDDNDLFLRNARDFLLRIRSHPSVGLYCGRNEGDPPQALDAALRGLVTELDPGLHYISNSAGGVVSGHGPYQAMPEKFYFTQRATLKLHSELGMPASVTLDSLRLMMPEAALWPQGAMWGAHDFTLGGAQGGASFRDIVDQDYGGADNAADWVELAQFVNYAGYRAMFEAQGQNRMGLLIWMSHPAWPSLVWQTYDYYFDPTAAYFGAKKACEPLHIQWNPATDNVEVVNYSAGDLRGLTAHAEIRNLDGTLQWEKTVRVDSPEDSVQTPIRLEYPGSLSAVHFICLTLLRGGEVASNNFYWRGTEDGNYRALRDLPEVNLEAHTDVARQGDRWLLKTELRNNSPWPALMVHLKAVRETSGDRILPAFYSDNYVSLMPGEQKTIRTEVAEADTRGEQPRILIEGFHIGAPGTQSAGRTPEGVIQPFRAGPASKMRSKQAETRSQEKLAWTISQAAAAIRRRASASESNSRQ